MSFRHSGTITNRFYVKNWVYKGGVKKSCPMFTSPRDIYRRPLFTSPLYIRDLNSGHDTFNFNLIYTKFYADFRSGLRFGCYQRTILRFWICLPCMCLCPLQWHHLMYLHYISTMPRHRHIFLRDLKLLMRPYLYFKG